MLSLARRLAIRQEVEDAFGELAEDARAAPAYRFEEGARTTVAHVRVFHPREKRLGKSRGPCEACGDPVHDPRAKWCPKCARAMRNAANLRRTLARQEKRQSAKACTLCRMTLGGAGVRHPVRPWHRSCAALWIAEQAREELRRRNLRRRKPRTCRDCGAPVAPYVVRCAAHRMARDQALARLRSLAYYHRTKGTT